MEKRVLMIAGPNGAGKTTMASSLIINSTMIYEFINADQIAYGLAPLHPESMALTASKLMIERLKKLLNSSKSFAFETTAAGTNYLKYLKEAQKKGYETNLVFLWLPSPEQAIERVASRVKQGGHNIPVETIRRRYYSGLKNLLKYYAPLSDNVLIMDNSSDEGKTVIARKFGNNSLEIKNTQIWNQIKGSANV